MIILTVMFYVIVFTLCAGVAISAIIFIPLTIYIIPYCLWVGFQHNKGKQKDKLTKGEKLTRTASDATKVYKAWLIGKEPIL